MLRAHAIILTFISLFFFDSAFAGSDGFSAIRCGADDVAKALIGKKMSNERIVDLEKRHEDLGLKDLGATGISEGLSCTAAWQVNRRDDAASAAATKFDGRKFKWHRTHVAT
jgi:hypothetical protein